MTPTNIRIGKSNYGGQDAGEGVTFAAPDPTEVGDAVTLSGPATVARGADGADLIGVLVTKDADGLGAVWSFESVTIVRVSGALPPGVTQIAGDGSGAVRAVAAPAGLKVAVIGTAVVGGVTYAALYRV